MFHHCVNDYDVMAVVLEAAILMMRTNPVPES
jgi:hypothetical protein